MARLKGKPLSRKKPVQWKLVLLFVFAILIDFYTHVRRLQTLSENKKALAMHFIVLGVAVSMRVAHGVEIQFENLLRIETVALVAALTYLIFNPPKTT